MNSRCKCGAFGTSLSSGLQFFGYDEEHTIAGCWKFKKVLVREEIKPIVKERP